MRWDKLRGLKWYEALWAALPVALFIVGGAIGAVIGGAAVAANVALMKRQGHALARYGLAGLVSVGSAGGYYLCARILLTSLGLAGPSAAQVDHELEQTPSLAALRNTAPETYAQLRAAVIDDAAHGRSKDKIAGTIDKYLTGVITKYLPVASDEAILEMTRVTILELDQISAKSADACFAFLFHPPGTVRTDLSAYATPEVIQAVSTAQKLILESGFADPQPVPSKEEVSAPLKRVVQQLVATYGAADITALAQPAKMDHGRYCMITSALFKEVLTLPRAEGVPLLRYLYAQAAI